MTWMTRLLASRITQLVVVAASLLAAASMGGGFLAGVVLVPMLVVLGARAGRVAAVVDGGPQRRVRVGRRLRGGR